MEQTYEVCMSGSPVGTVRVSRQGLYYRFSCRCRPTTREVFRLMVRCGGKEESLGVPVPEQEEFVLETRLPVKRVGEGDMEFRLAGKSDNQQEQVRFVPIYPEEPFAYMERLQNAFLAVRQGQPGAVFSEEAAMDAWREK